MKRAWIAIALLSASWLVGAGYYHHAEWTLWAFFVVGGAAMLIGAAPPFATTGIAALLALALFIPVIFLAPWPVSGAPALMALGIALSLVPLPRRWPRSIGGAAFSAGAILTFQAVAVFAYQSCTGRSHELPQPLAELLGGLAQLCGMDAAADGNTVALHTMRKLHALGATWDLLLDPVSLAFMAGASGLIALRTFTRTTDERPESLAPSTAARLFLKRLGILLAVFCLWLPLRATLMMAILVHRALHIEFDSPLILMDQFRNTWVLMAMLAAPVALLCRFLDFGSAGPMVEGADSRRAALGWKRGVGMACAGAAAFVLTFAGLWDPAGTRKLGRVLVDEHHSKWEPTQRPFDTDWYGQNSGYNYYCIYDYLSRYYTMGRIETPIDDNRLADCDVLIVKVPTENYEKPEVDAIERFVRRGGGVLLVGEHTDVFGTGVSLNDIGKRFGVTFRYDVILDTDTAFEQKLMPPLVRHPTIQYFDDFDFAVTCSIDPGASAGRAVVLSRSLRGLGPDYHASNYYPQIDDAADERYGAFVQAWATRAGRGRVFAWSDSTVWSNFCTFEPGKAELMLGLVEWLNHRDGALNTHAPLWVLAVLLLLLALYFLSGPRGGLALLLAGGFLGWCLAAPSLRAVHAHNMPPPVRQRPLHRVIMDRTVCATPLSHGGFIEGKPDGFGVFERWVLRLGYFLKRSAGDDALHDDLLVFTYPSKDVPDAFREKLVQYVADGGKVLVIDSAENEHSSANSLLYPFGLQVNRQAPDAGDLTMRPGWPATRVASTCEITGGEAFIQLNTKPVASTIRYGKGSVTALGFGSRLTDPNMGVTGDTIPDDDLRKTYDLDFALMRWLVEGRQPAAPSTQPATQPSATPPATAPAAP